MKSITPGTASRKEDEMIKLSEYSFYDPRTGIRYIQSVDRMVIITSAHSNKMEDGFSLKGKEAETLWTWLNEEWQYEATK